MDAETPPAATGTAKSDRRGAVISSLILFVLVSGCVAFEIARIVWFIEWLRS